MDNLKQEAILSTANIYLLLLAVVISILNHNITEVLNYVFNFTNKLNNMPSHKLKVQLKNLQKECCTVDMTDEFAKYARLQRKIIKIQDELKKEASTETETNMKNKMLIRAVVHLFCIAVMYWCNAQPVVHMSPEWLYPLSSVLCWPGAEPGSISFLVWCAISNSVVRTFS